MFSTCWTWVLPSSMESTGLVWIFNCADIVKDMTIYTFAKIFVTPADFRVLIFSVEYERNLTQLGKWRLQSFPLQQRSTDYYILQSPLSIPLKSKAIYKHSNLKDALKNVYVTLLLQCGIKTFVEIFLKSLWLLFSLERIYSLQFHETVSITRKKHQPLETISGSGSFS